MVKSTKLGMYWGANNIACAQTSNPKNIKVFQIPLSVKKPSETTSPIPDGLQLISLIQQGLEKERIKPGPVNLSLPVKDIIFRSFIIPAMQPNELKGVVEFEARKYIPFSLDELSYAFHTIKLAEEGVKKQRIIFAAIKKATLLNYIHKLEQIGMEINIIEPSPVSLIRYLLTHNYIGKNETLAVIEKNQNRGKIFIIDQLTPVFVREFQLSALQNTENENGYNARLVNEIRISLDYFMRQDRNLNISNILLLTQDDLGNLPDMIHKEFKYTVKLAKTNLDNKQLSNNSDIFNALGASAYDQVLLPGQFNLIQKVEEEKLSTTFQEAEKFSFKPLIFIGIVCGFFIGGVYLWSSQTIEQAQNKIKRIQQKMGPFSDTSVTKLNQKIKEYEKKQENLKNIKFKSNISSFLAVIPTLLPDNAWIKELSLDYREIGSFDNTSNKGELPTDFSININGYVYSENSSEQFSVVDQFIHNLKNHPLFKNNLRNINLDTMKLDKIKEYPVTNFKIKCD